MHAPRIDDGEHRYLVLCPACSVSNAVNATACWRCEQRLPVPGLSGALGALLEPPFDAAGEPARRIPPPSFFPVLRDEADEAANDVPSWDSVPALTAVAMEPAWAPTRAEGRRRELVVAALGVALAIALGVGALLQSLGPESVPPDAAVAQPVQALPAPSTAGAAVEPVSVTAVSPSEANSVALDAEREPRPAATRAARVDPVPPARAPSRTEPPMQPRRVEPAAAEPAGAPPPVAAPCTRNIAALGLCSLDPS